MATNSKTFAESTSRSQTQSLTIPRLLSVANVTVNTGNVSYSVNGETITFTLSNGAYSRAVQTGGSYTPPDTKVVSVTNRYTSSSTWEWTGTSWTKVTSSSSAAPGSVSYNQSGYSGTLNKDGSPTVSGDSELRVASGPASNGTSVGQRITYTVNVDQKYTGSVTKPATDTRTYSYYYQYTVTVDYTDNAIPSISLMSPADNQTLSEGNTLPVQGSATDADSGNVVTAKYKINNGTIRALQSGVSDGSTPISFAKTLTYSNKRIWDGTTDIVGADLAENTDHTLTVWSEDDEGGKSTEVTGKFKVVWNRPPTISGEDEDLGTTLTPPAIDYSAVDPEGNTFTFTEYLNGQEIRTFPGTAGQNYTVQISHDAWIRLNLDVQHQVKIKATDSAGISSERVYTFTRTETHIEFMLNFDSPDVQGHFILDGMPERVLVTLERYIPEGAEIENVKVCNNALDAFPTWEDATSAVKANRGYLFTNTTKTAANWAINIWVIIAKGTATERVRLNGYGGAFD